MTQDDRWLSKYNEVKDFIVKNHRNPSRHNIEDHLTLNWIKHNRKLLNKGEMKDERKVLFLELLYLIELNKRENQYQ